MDSTIPAEEWALAEQIRDAAESRTPLRIAGGRTKLSLGEKVSASGQVSTTTLTGIVTYEPGALSLVVKAGTPLSDIETALAAEGQHLAFEPPDWRLALGRTGEQTIGGLLACGLSGPRRIRAGAARDALLGVRFINGKGEVIRNGGQVMKNVTGYDLVKLMAGSYGTLGVLTELAFKTAPIPEAEQTLRFGELDDIAGVALLRQALRTPYEVSAAAFVPGDAGGAFLRVEGEPLAVARRINALREMMRTPSEILDDGASRKLWSEIAGLKRYSARTGPLWRVSIKPTAAPGFVRRLKRSFDLSEMYDWGGGLVWLECAPGQKDAGPVIRDMLEGMGGHATRIRREAGAGHASPVFHPESPAIAALSERIRAGFDPHGILNPGLMGPPVSAKPAEAAVAH